LLIGETLVTIQERLGVSVKIISVPRLKRE
jgi:hypothetical protein